jgi:hypothetical protein
MRKSTVLLCLLPVGMAGCASRSTVITNADGSPATQQVIAAETAFAKTMADRNYAAFLSHISSEAIFLSGGNVLRGRDATGHIGRSFTPKRLHHSAGNRIGWGCCPRAIWRIQAGQLPGRTAKRLPALTRFGVLKTAAGGGRV